MSLRTFFVTTLLLIASAPLASGQSSLPVDESPSKGLQVNLLQTLSAGDLVRAANDYREGSVALAKLADTVGNLPPIVAEMVVSVSDNMAAMSSGFDPFGFKTAFETVQRQNEIIRDQAALIQRLQQQEIDRLRSELDKLEQQQ